MRILKIIHGYPPLFNAGSEVYSRTLAHGLNEAGHEVAVFTRFEDPFLPEYTLEKSRDPLKPDIILYKVNMARDRDCFSHKGVDAQLEICIEEFDPEIAHIGHLNHLSTSMVEVIADHKIPLVFTLHDYWLMCPRGQFLQTGLGDEELWALCDGQDDEKCARKCYSRYFTGLNLGIEADVQYWTNWIHRRMVHVKQMITHVDKFIAPSQHLYSRFINEFKLPTDKTIYLDYGFNLKYLMGRQRINEEAFVFGYIGTQIPAKGIQYLLTAFSQIKGNTKLRIFGRNQPQNSDGLKSLITKFPSKKQRQIEWFSEYQNEEIVTQVFNKVDALVVPSIWDENSPLVIHEAQQVRIPVITANQGGMKEYIAHEVNGSLFQQRDVADLAKQMQRFVEAPIWGQSLGQRGYLHSQTGHIPSIEDHIKKLLPIYESLIEELN